MNAFAVLARVALYAYPNEFRAQFGETILADVAAEPANAAVKLADIVRAGIAMRFETLILDARYAARRLRSSPFFVALVVLTFALGIGTNVAVFSVLNAVVLQPLPFPHASRLVVVQSDFDHRGATFATSITDASDLRSHTTSLAQVAALRSDERTLIAGNPLDYLRRITSRGTCRARRPCSRTTL